MKGQKLLQVSAILLIVFYGLGILLGCIGGLGLIGMQAELDSQSFGLAPHFFNFTMIWISSILSFIVSLFGLTSGILGVAFNKQKEKAKICLAMGIVLIILVVIERIVGIFAVASLSKYARYFDDYETVIGIYTISGIIGLFVALVTPILYTVGAGLFSKNDNIYPPYNNGSNQYPPYNNGNNQYPNNNNNQYPNN